MCFVSLILPASFFGLIFVPTKIFAAAFQPTKKVWYPFTRRMCIIIKELRNTNQKQRLLIYFTCEMRKDHVWSPEQWLGTTVLVNQGNLIQGEGSDSLKTAVETKGKTVK